MNSEEVLTKTTEELLEAIGKDITKGRSVVPLSKKALVDIGRSWFQQNYLKISNHVCNNERIRKLYKDKNIRRRTMLIVALGDLLMGIISGVSPITVSALLMKEGLETVCRNQWADILD